MSYRHKRVLQYFFTNKWPGGRFLQWGSRYTERVENVIIDDISIVFDELNVPISPNGVSESIKQLKNGKAGAEDLLVN